MRLSVLEPFREPCGPAGGEVFDNLTLEAAIGQIRGWKITGRTLFKIEESTDRWMTFDTHGAGEFEASFQSSPAAWQRIIGVRFNTEGCCLLASSFFTGDESLLYRYPLDTRPASKKLTAEELQRVQAIQERMCRRRWWEFWK